ncbi:hypothetical protein BH581_12435 [Vibrio splendidus]|uniref:hypothetical protein n=1 Tax=Vibrio splendidus TaxID=29497 RepID=UPI00097694F0|nr:hypothetical protein [Vibrio splendidus]OMO27146.1 hypothetical protein BH581_12435 [Vibrio splendidus]
MNNRLVNGRATVFIIIGILFSVPSALSLAADVQLLGDSGSQVIAVSEQREQLLAEYSQDESLTLDQRIAATVNLGMYYGPNSIIAVARASRSEFPQMRLAAIQAAEQWQGRAKWDVVAPMLNDVDRDVEAQAVRTLVVLWPQLAGEYLERLSPAIEKHLSLLANDLNGNLERAWIYTLQNKHREAESIYSDLFEFHKQPRVAIAYAEYLKSIDDDERAQAILKQTLLESPNSAILKQTLLESPNSAMLHYSLGLSYLRSSESAMALSHLKEAYELEPTSGSYGYIYATVVRETDAETAISVYRTIYQNHAQPTYLYALCETLLSSGKDADECLTELEVVAPQDVVSKLKKIYLPN